MNTTPLIKTTSVNYSFSQNVKTLSDINMEVERGSIYGFLGPNGSGKTTTLRLLLGLLRKQEGSIQLFGHELNSNRIDILRKTGSLIENVSLYGHLTAKENLEVYRRIYGMPKERISEVLKLVDLDKTGRKSVRKFSLGMKQRLSIALSLLQKPELLILDEPTNGLDPNGMIELRELVKRLNKEEGITILISSHILAEVEKMVSHIGIIAKGRLLFQGSMQQLQQLQQTQCRLQINTHDNDAAAQLLNEYRPTKVHDTLFLCYDKPEQIAAISRTLVHNNIDIYLVRPEENNLEQLFMDLTSTQS